MKHITVRFEVKDGDGKAMKALSSKVCGAMGKDGSFDGVSVTAISRGDIFKQLEDIEDCESIDELSEILSKPYF